MKLLPRESDLVGNWISLNGQVSADTVEQRINALITNYLEKISVGPDGWDALYRDPADGRYWELTFSHSDWHGGGPRRLTNISPDLAVSKYQIIQQPS